MRIRVFAFLFVPTVWLVGPSFAQDLVKEGITLGNVVLRPRADALAAYDSRVRFNEATDDAEGDYYGQVSVGATLNNLPAVFDLSANASYGRRYYVDFTENDDDFYNAGISVGSDGESPLRWQLAGDVAKTLNYDVSYDPETGEGPPSILTDGPSKRWTARGTVGYAIPLSDVTFVVPEYSLMHYYQEFENADSSEWQTHDVSLLLNHVLSERITLLAGGYYMLQTNDDEEGYIITVGGGARGQLTDKTSWKALVGMAYADYELSGSGQGGVVDLRANWQATEKISAYVFYGNQYQPGYGGGGARMVYRGGYGAGWAFVDRWSLGGQVLHNYNDELGSDSSADSYYGGVNHFFTTQLTFNFSRGWSAMLQGRYVKDRYPEDKQIVSLSARYTY